MRYALKIEDRVELHVGSTPLPEGAIEPIPNWDEISQIFSGYLKIVDGQILEKTQEEKDAYDLAHPSTLEDLQESARIFLNNTDWYIIRSNDPSSGKSVPQEILLSREKARDLL